MVISHTGIVAPAARVPALVEWYTLALAPLGYAKTMTFLDGLVNGYSDGNRADWWITASRETDGEAPAASASHHAFAAKDRATVEAFHKAAVEAGGKDNGAPGVRAQYGPKYFAAFVLDPAGNNIEAVYNGDE